MKKILDKRSMSESDWQVYRSQQAGIGGSEVASVLGIQPNYAKSAFTLWLEKTGQKEVEPVDNEFVTWGNIMEPIIRKQFAKESGMKIFQNNFVLQHDDYDFMIANIDGEILDPSRKGRGVLEIKTTSEWNKKEWEGDSVPLQYNSQVQHYLAVTGYEYAYIVVLIGGNKLRHWIIERDEITIELIIKAEKHFMDLIASGEPPAIGGGTSDTDYLANRYPISNGEELTMPQTLEDLALEYSELSEQEKEIKKRMAEIKNKIRLEAKEVEKLKGRSVIINMATIQKTLFDSKAFAVDHADLYNDYKTKTSTYRDFKVKKLEA